MKKLVVERRRRGGRGVEGKVEETKEGMGWELFDVFCCFLELFCYLVWF